MNKNVLIKSILVLIVIALLAFEFTGCGIVVSSTGTVIVTVTGDYMSQKVYIDGVYQATFSPSGILKIYNVPMGNHLFESIAVDGWKYGYKWQYIHGGTNYVHIKVSH